MKGTQAKVFQIDVFLVWSAGQALLSGQNAQTDTGTEIRTAHLSLLFLTLYVSIHAYSLCIRFENSKIWALCLK